MSCQDIDESNHTITPEEEQAMNEELTDPCMLSGCASDCENCIVGK